MVKEWACDKKGNQGNLFKEDSKDLQRMNLLNSSSDCPAQAVITSCLSQRSQHNFKELELTPSFPQVLHLSHPFLPSGVPQ